ncbi:hypothetical protein JCM9279_006737 [Rhodotorula babjevae]
MSYPQTCINPDAPWTTFINARSRALSAYGLFQDSRRQRSFDSGDDPETSSAAQRERLSAAFVRLSLALDRVTVPIRYWSETPYEAVGSAASHTALVRVLDECELRLRRIVDVDLTLGESPRASSAGGGEQEADEEDSLEDLATWMHVQAGFLEAQQPDASHTHAVDLSVPSYPPGRPLL